MKFGTPRPSSKPYNLLNIRFYNVMNGQNGVIYGCSPSPFLIFVIFFYFWSFSVQIYEKIAFFCYFLEKTFNNLPINDVYDVYVV